MAPSRRSPDVRPTTSSISAHSTPTPASPRARQQYYAQTHGIKQFYRAGAAWLGEDVSFRRLPVLADEPRHAHHSADKAPVDRNERPARHTARHTGQSVFQRALLVEPRRARPGRHHVGESGSKGALDPSGRHGRGHAHAQAACTRSECRQSAEPVSGRERADRGARAGDRHVGRVEAAAGPPAGASARSRHQRVPVRRAGDCELDALQGLELDAHLSGRHRSAGRRRHHRLANFLAQRSSHVDIDSQLIIDPATQDVKGAVLNQLDLISKTTKADIFLLMPKQPDIESASFNGNIDTGMDPRLPSLATSRPWSTPRRAS
jgi:hypothetical protein